MNISHPPTGMSQIRPTVTTGQALIPGTGGTGFQAPTLSMYHAAVSMNRFFLIELYHEKTSPWDFRPGQPQTGLYNQR